MGLPPWETSDSQLFALITGANSGLGYAIAARLIDEFITSPATSPSKHLILILCTRTPLNTRFTISRLRAHLRRCVEYSEYAKKLAQKAKAQGKTYKWEDQVQRVHFLGVEVDLCDLKGVYRLTDRLVNGTVGSPDATTIDGRKLPHGSPGTQSFSDNVQQDRWALSQEPGSVGAQRSWGWGLSGIRIPRLDVVILSAGIGGWAGVNWPIAIRDVLFDTVEAVTYPKFKIPTIGARSKPQSSYGAKNGTKDEEKEPLLAGKSESTEPPLGKVFCSNIFGHYILAHELMPLLSRPASPTSKSGGKIVWVSSIEGLPENVSLDDIQALKSKTPYEDTKGLIDIMSLTSSLPSVQRAVSSYFDSSKTVSASKSKSRENGEVEELPLVKPKIYLTHPGIFCSEIMPLPAILVFFYRLIFIFARWIGSVWHPGQPYKAAVAPTWIALTDDEVLEDMEGGGMQKAKWGSASNRSGEERVMKTEVKGWGWNGVVGTKEGGLGRKRGAVDVTKEEREDFEVLGAKCWAEMEELRRSWEGILGVRDTEK